MKQLRQKSALVGPWAVVIRENNGSGTLRPIKEVERKVNLLPSSLTFGAAFWRQIRKEICEPS